MVVGNDRNRAKGFAAYINTQGSPDTDARIDSDTCTHTHTHSLHRRASDRFARKGRQSSDTALNKGKGASAHSLSSPGGCAFFFLFCQGFRNIFPVARSSSVAATCTPGGRSTAGRAVHTESSDPASRAGPFGKQTGLPGPRNCLIEPPGRIKTAERWPLVGPPGIHHGKVVGRKGKRCHAASHTFGQERWTVFWSIPRRPVLERSTWRAPVSLCAFSIPIRRISGGPPRTR